MQCYRSSATHLLGNTRRLSSFKPFGTKSLIRCEVLQRSWSTSSIDSVQHSSLITNLHESRKASNILSKVTFPFQNDKPSDLAFNLESGNTTAGPLTSAQISRIASQGVRMAIERHQPGDAITIIQSLSHSVKTRSSPTKLIDPLRKPAIDFGLPVSPRLASHCLLHGLIRSGHYKQADTAAKQMFQLGIPVHSKSLEAIVHSLCHKASPTFDRSVIGQVQKVFKSTTLLEASKLVRNANISRALELVHHAKQYNRQRTRQMFLSLIDACLLQGELLIAAFLFSFLVKQYFSRNHTPALAD